MLVWCPVMCGLCKGVFRVELVSCLLMRVWLGGSGR